MKRDSGTHCDRSGETREGGTCLHARDHLMATAAARRRARARAATSTTSKESAGRSLNSRGRLEGRLRFDRVSETPGEAPPRMASERRRERKNSDHPSVRAAARESIIWSGYVVAVALRASLGSICHLLSAANSPSHADCAAQWRKLCSETRAQKCSWGKKVRPNRPVAIMAAYLPLKRL